MSDVLKTNSDTSDKELNNVAKDQFGRLFRGVYSSDQVPKLKNWESCILNTDPHDKPGLHWVAIVKYNNQIYFYDSYNRNYKTLSKHWKNKDWLIIDHGKPEEAIYGENCGQLALSAIYLFYKYKNPYVWSVI